MNNWAQVDKPFTNNKTNTSADGVTDIAAEALITQWTI